LRGSIVKLTQFHFGAVQLGLSQDPTSTLDTTTAVLPFVIENFIYIGANGCPTHGDPRYVTAVPIVRSALAHYKHFGQTIQLPPSQTQVPFGSSFDPEELARLDDFTSQIEPLSMEEDPLEGVELEIPATQRSILDSIFVEKIQEYKPLISSEETSPDYPVVAVCSLLGRSEEIDKLIVRYFQNRFSKSLSMPIKYNKWAKYCSFYY
jgi:hypothetical protein